MRKLILLAVLTALPQFCRAGESCLWLNEATAAGILGGPVKARVLRPAKDTGAAGTANAKSSAGPMNANPTGPSYVTMNVDDEDCVFARSEGAISSEMRIEVRTAPQSHMAFYSRLASCGVNKVPLQAIGNEAMACDAKTAARKGSPLASEQVAGRVRDRIFVVSVTSNEAANGPAALRESATAAARVVAGNLF